jgi:energy-coupling factor transporter ATP-binding protein EcfA2
MTEGQSVAAAVPGQGAGAGFSAAPPAVVPASVPPQGTAPPGARPPGAPPAASPGAPRHAAPPRAPGPEAAAPGSVPPGSSPSGAVPHGAAPAEPSAADSSPAEAPPAEAPPAEAPPVADGAPEEQAVRVNAKAIETAILALRKPIVAAQLPLEAPGVTEARAERRKLLGQIDDYLLPRLRESGSPVLVALVGSTGAGKSTLVNSIVGAEVSMTGIRRPTTNSPVLACHPGDVDWFAENVFLPTVPRVRQEGLARSGRDGLLVLAASEGMPPGVALLDTPDIDSVVQAHRDFAHQFLDASDLWLFMTTAARYADAAVWELLQQARDRGASLGIVLSRVHQPAAPQLIDHFGAMLEANGLSQHQRFLILETVLTEGKLPPEASDPIRQWLAEAAQSSRRVAVLSQTMTGVLDTFPARIPALAAQVEVQAAAHGELVAAVDSAYRGAVAEIGTATADGSLLRGEVLARWQDFAGTGDLLRALQAKRPGGRQRRYRSPARAQALRSALRTAIESLITLVADRAAEDAVSRWRGQPAGAALLDQLAAGTDDDWDGSQLAADARLIFGLDEIPAGEAADGPPDPVAALARASADLATRAARDVGSWQEQVLRLVKAENVTKRSIARAVNFDDESLATLLMIGLMGSGVPEDEADESATAIPHRLLTSLFGGGPLRDVTLRARADLLDRVQLIFDEEMLRFTKVIARTEVPDASAAVQLYQAAYALEVTR